MAAYWGEEDTSVHFCEDKYKVTPYAAEYYNTLSSLYYVGIGLLFLNTRVRHLGQSLILMGIGAFLLHMTLRYYAQMLDEGTMLILSFNAARHIKPTIPRWIIVPLLVLYTILHNYFIYFFIIFTTFQIYMAYILLNITKSGSYVKIFILGYIVLFCLGTICWLSDQFLCSYVKDYQMHAWWHLFTSLAIGSGFLVFLF